MAARLAIHRYREEARARQRSDSFRRKPIASIQMAHGSSARCAIAASPEAVQSVWHPNAVADTQPLRWRTEAMEAPWGIIRRKHGATCLPCEAKGAATLAALDIGEAESHSLTPSSPSHARALPGAIRGRKESPSAAAIARTGFARCRSLAAAEGEVSTGEG